MEKELNLLKSLSKKPPKKNLKKQLPIKDIKIVDDNDIISNYNKMDMKSYKSDSIKKTCHDVKIVDDDIICSNSNADIKKYKSNSTKKTNQNKVGKKDVIIKNKKKDKIIDKKISIDMRPYEITNIDSKNILNFGNTSNQNELTEIDKMKVISEHINFQENDDDIFNSFDIIRNSINKNKNIDTSNKIIDDDNLIIDIINRTERNKENEFSDNKSISQNSTRSIRSIDTEECIKIIIDNKISNSNNSVTVNTLDPFEVKENMINNEKTNENDNTKLNEENEDENKNSIEDDEINNDINAILEYFKDEGITGDSELIQTNKDNNNDNNDDNNDEDEIINDKNDNSDKNSIRDKDNEAINNMKENSGNIESKEKQINVENNRESNNENQENSPDIESSNENQEDHTHMESNDEVQDHSNNDNKNGSGKVNSKISYKPEKTNHKNKKKVVKQKQKKSSNFFLNTIFQKTTNKYLYDINEINTDISYSSNQEKYTKKQLQVDQNNFLWLQKRAEPQLLQTLTLFIHLLSTYIYIYLKKMY
ncbi:hypothetical protein LY90DRAFT_514887 [Neocallimastix californiae]|uniref:Uncharacterized protein n=1 Tax=Neocallimastix californiae TaxID=1754190 RepID=A0A1Y2AP52_9FUNG|nr:hypothetical protein LY90DRAFT_514887 [Neocallimastix californiae]|eukprot:ORY23725.1 hypothetical protein LY90DRAFT_514887 [Neocallimastix californiae]